jgi:hypothetical protein
MLDHFSLFMKYLGKEGARQVGMILVQVRSLREQHSIQFAKMQLIGPILLMSRTSPAKA